MQSDSASCNRFRFSEPVLISCPRAEHFLSELTKMIAQQFNVSAPKQHVPLTILRLISNWTWLANQLEMSAEMLSFLRTEQLDLEPLKQFRQR